MSPSWPDLRNGIVTYTRTMRAGLLEQGIRVFVLANYARRNCGDADVIEVGVPGNDRSRFRRTISRCLHRGQGIDDHSKRYARRVLAVLRRLSEQEGLAVVEMEESFGRVGWVAKESPVPVVARIHGPWFLNGRALGVPEDRSFAARVSAEGVGLMLAHGVTAPSRDVLERSRAEYDLTLETARTIPNPVVPVAEVDRWSPESSEPGRILFVGRFDRHKGGDVMLDAFAEVRRRRPEAKLTFVGPDRGLKDDEGRFFHLDEYMGERLDPDTREAVDAPGIVPWHRLGMLRRRASVTVVPSRYEIVGYTALEALSWGCPLVACRTGGLAEVVQHGETGLLAAPGDAGEVAESIIRLLDDRDLAARLGAEAAVECLRRYSLDAVARQTLEYYRDLIDRRCGGSFR